MQTKIQKWGNSLAVRLPRWFAAEAQGGEGAIVDLSVEDGRLLVRPLRVRKYALSVLLRKISPRNLHGADTDIPVRIRFEPMLIGADRDTCLGCDIWLTHV